ncbi:hypothetical protein [Duganella sp. BJB476]|uniref:hypothetical protein n=1 Tax=Duganella sp. BJB476 TaxID=1871176 RepID=UPI000E342136|nr:hypothetical protein [Duganella sp. BJB476]RFP36146.1 hypothetical protein D0T21_06845 [Duganella sp. BJB476]
MRQPEDNLTGELPGIKAPHVTKKRGRPRLHENAAARQQAYRDRQGVKPLTVLLPAELHAKFEAWLKFKDLKKSDVIEKLISTQLLRKR